MLSGQLWLHGLGPGALGTEGPSLPSSRRIIPEETLCDKIFRAGGWCFSFSRNKWMISVSSSGEWVYGKFTGSGWSGRLELFNFFFFFNASCLQLLYLNDWQELTSLFREVTLEWPLSVIHRFG